MLQEEIENKIDTADALAIKLLQRFNYSVSAMRSTANSLAEGYFLHFLFSYWQRIKQLDSQAVDIFFFTVMLKSCSLFTFSQLSMQKSIFSIWND